MRWSRLLLATLRDDPQEAEIVSHKLMVRAGLIRKLSGGLYTFMPLGLRALHKVSRIVREEMDRAGALEVLMPALQPKNIWDETGRWASLAEIMYQFKDRGNKDNGLGATHEEVIYDLVRRNISSYRELPFAIYQIQNKFRNELRAKGGIMRGREFMMKDLYSFDLSQEDLDQY